MNGAEFQRSLEHVLLFGPTHKDQVARTLRNAGFLPSRGRGPHASAITPRGAAYFLLGLSAPVASDASSFVAEYALLPAVFENSTWTLGAWLEAQLESERPFGPKWLQLEIWTDWPQARLLLRDGQAIDFGSPERARARGFPTAAGGYRQVVFRYGAIAQIRIDIDDPEEIIGEIVPE